MAGNAVMFEVLYNQFNRTDIRKAYESLSQKSLFSNLFEKNPFSVEIRMNDDVFAMQLTCESPVSMELMAIIGYFFDKYSKKRNCVYTKDEKSIKKFFIKGIEEFIEYGGKIKYSLEDESKEKIVYILTDYAPNDIYHKKLVESFDMLSEMCWAEYKKTVNEQVEKEESERHIEEVTCMDMPLDYENVFSSDAHASGIHVESSADGLVLSLNNLGRVDIEYISQVTGKDLKEVITELKGSIYQNPETWDECFYKGWETADEYLSGRVAHKYTKVLSANYKYNGYFNDNVKALDKIIPESVSADDIYITLGSPWVPADIIDDFIEYAFECGCTSFSSYDTVHDEETGIWEIPKKSRFRHSVNSESVYGTKRINGLNILERTLNMKSIVVTDEVASLTNKSGKKRVINKAETLLAQEKQRKLIDDFKVWVWTDNNRKKRLEAIYEEKYCSNVIRYYDGSFLQFPQMDPNEHLYDYQKNAVARIMFTPNTLLAHDVGAGKTYIMIAAGMEMRRIGTSKKNLYVVPNNLVGQWRDMFFKLYPKANVLCVEPKSFTPQKRYKVMEDIRDKDYDGIIVAYSCFELMPVSKEYYREELVDQLAKLEKHTNKKNKINNSWNRKREEIKKALKELENKIDDNYELVYFDKLGINTLFVDEAHNFKNVPIKTSITHVLGISSKGSQKCREMMDKIKIVQDQNDGRGVVFATGTPISNSLTDIFVMQKYLQNGELMLLDLHNFDSWVGMFAEKVSNLEVDVDTNQYRLAERFTEFHNLPELSNLLASIADFHNIDTSTEIPDTDGYKDIQISKTKEFERYLTDISDRADAVRSGYVKRTEDNMLKITTDGRKAALDLRLVDENAIFTYQSKVAHCSENVFDIYKNTEDKRLSQLIFCDVSTPKQAFNIYDELKRLLTAMGVHPDEIAYIHDAVSEKKRSELFEKVRKGEIRILIGSTFKMGLGVNVQDKLIALHHLDVPWRPSDMVQREGRILRKGNQNKKVYIYRYITEGSFDAYSWQLLESKQHTISEILAGCVTERKCKEIADTVLDYAEVKAISIGNPLLKNRVETSIELSRNLTLQRKFIEEHQAMENEIRNIPNRIRRKKEVIEKCRKDIAFYSDNKRKYSKTERKTLREFVYKALMENELLINETNIGSYQGFDIILPSNMIKTKPFLYLQRNGKYCVEMGLSESGVAVRLDNCLDGLAGRLEELNADLERMYQREIDLKNEVQNKNPYADKITELKEKLKKIDKELEVNKK